MAYSYTVFTGNGSTTQYAVSFPYIRREHIAVTVAGLASTFTWVNNSLIQMDAAPAAAAAVRVYRTTPISAPLVDFADGSTLVAADLDTNSRQSIYIQQELNDAQVDNLADLIPNGDKGDITTSASGAVWAINASAVLEAKIATGAVTETKLGTGSVTSAKILDGTILNVDVNASAGITAGKLSFTQAGTGATARTIDSKLKDVVSVKDFGAVGDGVADDAAAIQAAVNTGKAVFLPKGVYKLLSPITLATVGQRFFGESSQETYLTGGLDHDQLRIAASHCEVDHIHFRPSGGSNASPPVFAPLRIYAALSHVHDNRFLSSAVNTGCGILLDDVDPATSAVIAGAYAHTISDNRIGASGYDFRYGIYSYNANNGQQATKFQNNQILSNLAIYVFQGGGNYYVGNLLQSATGTYVTGAGNGIDLQTGVTGETITGNYIERYQYGVITRRVTQDYILINAYGNHWDNNTTNIYFVSSPLAAYFDEVSLYDTKNTWQWRYNSQDNLKLINREGIEILNVNRANYVVEPRVLGHNLFQSLAYSANGQTQTPTASWCEITGSGAARTGCFLGNGTRGGQHLYFRAHTWSVELLNNPGGTQNIVYASGAASATFGQSGNVGTMHLIWDATYGSGRWFEISRTLA